MSASSARANGSDPGGVGTEISRTNPVFALIPKSLMALAEVFTGSSRETEISRDHSIKKSFSVEQHLDDHNKNHDHTLKQTRPNGYHSLQKETHLFDHHWPKFDVICGGKNCNKAPRSRNGCCTKDVQLKKLSDCDWKPGKFLPRKGHAIERLPLKVHEQSYIPNFPNNPVSPSQFSHWTSDEYSPPIVMLPFLITPQGLIPASPCAEQLSSPCGTCGSQNEYATCSESIVQMEPIMCDDKHSNDNIRPATSDGHLNGPYNSYVSVFDLETPVDSKIIEIKPKRENLEHSSKLSSHMGELLKKEVKPLPDSVSDAASNYALDEVLSKYNDSTVKAEDTAEQESTDTDESDKILTKQWNIPSTSSLKNSVKTPSLALIRDQKGNVSLEVQHDLLYICDKKRDKANEKTKL